MFRILFVGLCCREKGLFDAVEAVALLAAKLKASASPVSVRLEVAGRFYREAEQREFDERVGRDDLRSEGSSLVRHWGFVEGGRKSELFRDCDCLCFPTYYSAETFGLVLVEAMAYGMPCVASRWRTIPELFEEGYAGLVDPQSPGQLAITLEAFLRADHTDVFRERYLRHYTLDRWLTRMREVLGSVQE